MSAEMWNAPDSRSISFIAEHRPLRAADAESRRTRGYGSPEQLGGALLRRAERIQHAKDAAGIDARFFDVGRHGCQPFRDAREHGFAGVFARHRQEILSVNFSLQVRAAQ